MRSSSEFSSVEWTVDQAQNLLQALALSLLAVQDLLLYIAGELPVPDHQEEMLEGAIPPDMATEISGRMEYIADDLLRGVIESVHEAGCLTAGELKRKWRKDRWDRDLA